VEVNGLGPVLEYIIGFLAASASVLSILLSVELVRRREPETERLRARLGELLTEKEALERRLIEAEDRLVQLEAERARLIRELEEERQARHRLEKELKRLQEEAEQARIGLAIYEAYKAEVISVVSKACDGTIVVHPNGELLCVKGRTMEIVWPPEEGEDGGRVGGGGSG